MINVLSVPHQVTRLVFDTGQPYEKFRSRYEAAVPPVQLRRPGDFAGRHARWPDLAAHLGEPSPHGFVLYWRAVMTPLMTSSRAQAVHRLPDGLPRHRREDLPPRPGGDALRAAARADLHRPRRPDPVRRRPPEHRLRRLR